MKKTFKTLLTTSMMLALPFSFISCDDNDDSSNGSDAPMIDGGDMTGDTTGDTTDTGSDTNSSCFLEGKRIRYIGEQDVTTEATTPVASTTSTEIEFDYTIEFLSNEVSRTVGTTDVKSISATVAGVTTNITQGLGPQSIDEQGTYDCTQSTDFTAGAGRTLTFSEETNGVTTTVTLNFTSDTSGTFTTTFTGSPSAGTSINGNSNGTFEIL